MHPRLFTLGHSTHAADEVLDLVREHAIELVVDVRRSPYSRRQPYFNRSALSVLLASEQIAYEHMEALGGRREPREDSPNIAWRESGFRGYADWVQTEGFESGLRALTGLAVTRRAAILCAEADPLHCHRRLIADVLVARGAEVVHILARGALRPHELDPRARIGADGKLFYPDPLAGLGGQLSLGFEC